jgi:hypothetical protein
MSNITTRTNLYQLRIEHVIARTLLFDLIQGGWSPVAVNNGEELIKTSDPVTILEHIFSVDDATLAVRKRGSTKRRSHGILLIDGNGPDYISDYNYYVDDEDGFDAWMNNWMRDNDFDSVDTFIRATGRIGEWPEGWRQRLKVIPMTQAPLVREPEAEE